MILFLRGQCIFMFSMLGFLYYESVNLCDIFSGELCMVCGPVGCGKSSLLAAILGEMFIQKGQMKVNRYVVQSANQIILEWTHITTPFRRSLFA